MTSVTTVLLKNLPYLLSSSFGVGGVVGFVDFVDLVDLVEGVEFIVVESSSFVVSVAVDVVVAGSAEVEVSSRGLLTICKLTVGLFSTNTI